MPAAVRLFLSMDRRRGSTAAMRATSGTGSEVARMSKEQMRQEKLYQATMSMVRKMLAEGLITEEEYRQIDTMFLANTALFSAHYSLKSVDFTAF